VEKLLKTKEENRNPIFDVRFTFNNIEPSTEVTPEVKPGPVAKIHNTSKFDMTLAGREVGEKLHFSFEYCTKLFKEETIKQFSHYFREILSTAAKNIDIKLQDIKLSHDFIDIESNIDQLDLDF
jgi:YesN/AraC family two-component response regulator